MKKTQWLALFKDIKATAVSFVSILLFVALGIAIFLGIKWNGPALKAAADAYYEEHGYHDFTLTFPYALTEDDLKAVEALELDAEGMYSANGTAWVDGERYVLAILSLTQRIDVATALTGVMPSAPDEVGIEKLFAEAAGLKLGDTLTIEAGSADSAPLHTESFIITAIIEHPSYIREENLFTRGLSDIGDGTVDYYVIMPASAFNPAAFDNCYSQLLVRSAALTGLDSFGAAYEAGAAEIAGQLKALGAERALLRCDALVSRYNAEIADGEERIAEAEGELEEGRREAAAGEQEIAEGEQKIAAGEREIADGEREIADNEKKLRAAQAAYSDGIEAYDEGEAQLRAARSKLKKALEGAGFGTDIPAAKTAIESKLEKLTAVRDLLDFILNAATNAKIQEKLNQFLADAENRQQLRQLINNMAWQDDTKRLKLLQIIDDFEANPAAQLTQEQIDLLKELAAGRLMNQLDDGISGLNTLLDAIDEYNRGARRLSQAKRELDAAAQSIEKGGKALETAKLKLEAAKQEIEAAKQALETGKQALGTAEQTIFDGELELSEKKALLDKAKADLAAFVRYDNWMLQKRSDNASYGIASGCAESSDKLCYTVALLFVFVGLMVCYTAVSRNVRESQILTGVQKALGFRKNEIMLHYMAYAVLAVILGVVLGGALGYYGIESIVNGAYARMFVFDSIPNLFRWKDLLRIALLELVLICLATYLPCRKLLKRQAVDLLRGDEHGGGRTRFYEKTKWWQRCSLYTQTTVSNLVNDSARVIATLVGVAGCTALIVMAMSVELCVSNTPKAHFAVSWRYDARLVCDGQVPDAMDSLRSVLETENVSHAAAMQGAVFIEDAAGGLVKSDLIVPEASENLAAFIGLNDWKSKRPLTLPEDGALISRTYAKYFDLDIGDTIRLLDMRGVHHDCVIAGVTEHYLTTYQLVMSRAYYARVMSAPAESNTFYIRYGQSDSAALQEKLEQTDGYFSCTDEAAKWSAVFDGFLNSTTLVLYIALLLAAVMALLVLLNLNVVFINEKAKELIIMRINGFSISATKKYIYRDNIVLTLLGILLGIGAGLLLADLTIHSLERTGTNFYIAVNPWACLTGAGLSGLFSLVSNLIALRRVNKLKISDIGRM